MFAQGTNQEVSEAIIIQMIGRAGRQQYNTSGRAYIMTKQEKVVSKKTLLFFFQIVWLCKFRSFY